MFMFCSFPARLSALNLASRRSVSRVLSTSFDAVRPFLWGRSRNLPQRDQPGRRNGNVPVGLCRHSQPAAPIRSCSRWGLPCQHRYRHCGALLPPRFTLTLKPCGNRAVCFLWHYPWGRPRRLLAGTVFPWSPDFPPPGFWSRQRPSDRLDGARLRLDSDPVNSAAPPPCRPWPDLPCP